jgi:DNA ligase (NAD+)
MMTPAELSTLVKRLEAANYAYHNGQTLLMTDAEYDAAIEHLRTAAPTHPFLTKVGAPIAAGDEVPLPVPLPSLNKIKTDLAKWTTKYPATIYHVSVKLDGCSALWLPASRRLYTRGDGMRGRDISAFATLFKGLPTTPADLVVRGELIMRTDSAAIPAGKLARNIVAGALNRKAAEADPALFSEIRFVAYELLQPTAKTPEEAFRILRTAGYEVARSTTVAATDMSEKKLSEIFDTAEKSSPYQLDGIVVAPNVGRPASWTPEVRNGLSVNPQDRIAWKTRLTAQTATTMVNSVEWNVSSSGYLIPRVLFDTVQLAGANISAATGLHGRWIWENSIGPGACIEIRRSGDVIPQIIEVHIPALAPSMPPTYEWVGDSATAVHIRMPVGSTSAESECSKLSHALSELGAENVGPGIIAKLYAAGFNSLNRIYAASASDFAARVEGCKDKGAERIWTGLRAKQSTWTEINLMVASCALPRGIGHTKLAPLFAIQSDPTKWSRAEFKAARPAGLSDKTIDAIMDSLNGYYAWRAMNPLICTYAPTVASTTSIVKPGALCVVFTGARDKELEGAMIAAGHVITDTVTKKTTHVVYPDGPVPTSSKITKAQAAGIPTIPMSELKALL